MPNEFLTIEFITEQAIRVAGISLSRDPEGCERTLGKIKADLLATFGVDEGRRIWTGALKKLAHA